MTPSEWAQWEWETYAPQYVHPAHHGHEHDADHHQHMVGRPAGATIGSHLRAEREEEAPVVLIAEDEETIAESLAMIVEEAGYTAIVALDGRQALMLARSHRPRVILTDLMMPYLSGSDLIASVRRDAAASGEHAPHIALITAASRARMSSSRSPSTSTGSRICCTASSATARNNLPSRLPSLGQSLSPA